VNIYNKTNSDPFDQALSVFNQISFFSCKNIFLDKKSQQDISKYIYCKDFSISPYEGSYGQHSHKWIQKYYIIKNAMTKKEQSEMEKHKNKMKAKTGR